MKFLILATVLFMGLQACNNNDTSGGGEKDPSVTQPPSENLPDSMKLLNDSVIVPDTTPGNGKQASNSDTMQQQ